MKDDVMEGELLDRAAQELQPYVERNAELAETTLARSQSRLLGWLTPNDARALAHDQELSEIRTGFEYRRRLLDLAVEARLQAVREQCDHLLMTGKSEIRRERQEFFAAQCEQLQQTMNACADRFNDDMEQRFQRLTQLVHPLLQKKEEERLVRAVEQFHDTLSQLTGEFQNILNERVPG